MTDTGSKFPVGWAACTLADAVTPGRPRGNPADFVGQPFIGLEHIEAHTTRMLDFVPAETMRSSGVQFSAGDVLYGRMRPYLNKVWLADRDGLCSGEFIVFPKTGAIRGAFLKYRLNAQDFVTFTDHATTGDRPRADFADFGKFSVLVPPLAEQIRIGDRIDELFTDLAAGVAALERVKRNLSRYRAAVLHAAVTGRLTEAWRKQHEPPDETGPKLLERILAERRRQWERRTLAKYEKAGKQLPKGWRDRYPEPSPPKLPSDGSALPELPKGWCWASLDQAGHLQRGRSRHRPRDAAHLYGGPYPFIQTGDIRKANLIVRSHTQTYSEAGLAQSQLWPAGTLCITIAANIAETAILGFEACFPDSVVGYHGVTPFVGTEYVMYFVKSVRDQLDRFAPATAQKNINDEILSQVPMPVPPLAEQSAIVESVSEKLSQIDGLEAEIERGLARACRLRQSILKAAFEGRLVPQDPADEPASALLERIRQQASEPTPKSNGDGHSVNETVLRRRGRPLGSRKAAPDAATTLTASTPAKAERSRKVRKQ